LLWNPEIIDEYISVLVKLDEFGQAIEAKRKFIKFLKQ
jgi:hypothetical protein